MARVVDTVIIIRGMVTEGMMQCMLHYVSESLLQSCSVRYCCFYEHPPQATLSRVVVGAIVCRRHFIAFHDKSCMYVR